MTFARTAGGAGRIPILLLVDCEPDMRLTTPGDPARWNGFEGLFRYLREGRAATAARTGRPARFSWFWRMDAQIEATYGDCAWPVRTYAHEVAEMERAGDEIGLHTHAWRWDAACERWIADHGNRQWIEQWVRRSFVEFERAFGRPCRIFRGGDGWTDQATLALIEQLGAYIDLTLEPGMPEQRGLVAAELSTGAIPDRRGVPRRPYHPSREDFRRRDRSGTIRLWELPVSSGLPSRRWRDWFAPAVAAATGPAQLNLGFAPGVFMPIFERAATSWRRPYAAICVRSDVGADAGLMACVERNLQAVLDHRLADRFAFVTATEALAMLTR
jgi:hypothetical protein